MLMFNRLLDSNADYRHGVAGCFEEWHGPYCIRKTTEFAISSTILILTLLFTINFIRNHGLRYKWILVILMFMMLALLANIIFCFLETVNELYSLETYFYNLYFLAIVGYVCQAYILKIRKKFYYEDAEESNAAFLTERLSQGQSELKMKIFYTVLFIYTALYTAIFITSIYSDVHGNSDNFYKDTCEELWYLCVNALCIALSIIVTVILIIHQKEEMGKIDYFRITTSLLSDSSGSEKSYDDEKRNSYHPSQRPPEKIPEIKDKQKEFSNPLKNLWIWIIINVSSQVIDFIESILLLNSTPEQHCAIIGHNEDLNNLLLLVFVILTMEMSYAASLWYFCKIQKRKSEIVVDRSQHYSQEYHIPGNIELFIPSKQQTITL